MVLAGDLAFSTCFHLYKFFAGNVTEEKKTMMPGCCPHATLCFINLPYSILFWMLAITLPSIGFWLQV
jgi:hypothetical protein